LALSDKKEKQQTQTEETAMKIAIPIAEGKLAMHFGHCAEFAVVEVDAKTKTITGKKSRTPPPHEPGVLPRWLHEQGVHVIIAGGMGSRAQTLFVENGIKVMIGAPSESPEVLVAAYLAGTLQTGANVCDH
jgi:predicted Fe-Mo cluster-binding NifX family protein